ncbi:MAG: HIT family protein [Butyrivibrio sp.]
MMKEDCIFCKLANGVFPTNTLYEDDEFRVILDIAPAAKGHALVLPKNHYEDALSADDDTMGKAMALAAKTGRALKKALGCDGINILQNNGTAAGQTVFHLHIHVIPRWDEDGIGLSWKEGKPSDEELKENAETIKKFY